MMKRLFEELINCGAWSMLDTPTEKILIAWFATKFPHKSLTTLTEGDFPAKMVAIATGVCRPIVAKKAIEAIRANEVFIQVYESCRSELLSAKSQPIHAQFVGNQLKEKGKEEERKGPPQTPFIKKEEEKGKENSSSSSDDEEEANENTASLSQEKVASIRQRYVTQGTDGVTPDVAEAANIPCDQVSTKVPIRDEAGFETFLQVYPKRRGLTGGGYFKTRKSWSDCELKGWTTDLILAAVDIARKTENWQRENYRFVPLAYHFLAEERMREFLPYDVVCKALNLSQHATQHLSGETMVPTETVHLKDPNAFEKFCMLYPKKANIEKDKEKLKQLWYQCELKGWSGETILEALNSAIYSDRWTEKNGLYKPNAFKFLEDEMMRDFLPIGYNPVAFVESPREITEAKDHPGMIFKLGEWWHPEELKLYAEKMILPKRFEGKEFI